VSQSPDDEEEPIESLELDSIVTARTEPIQYRQETTRAWIAGGLLALLAVLIIATFWSILFGKAEWSNIKDPVSVLMVLQRENQGENVATIRMRKPKGL